MSQIDDAHFDRADEYINLSNRHIAKIGSPQVSTSAYTNGEDMKAEKVQLLTYFVTQYELMLSKNLDDYIENFEAYMKA